MYSLLCGYNKITHCLTPASVIADEVEAKLANDDR